MSSKFCKTYKFADITVEAAYNYKYLDIQARAMTSGMTAYPAFSCPSV